jgi:hypothetical protein
VLRIFEAALRYAVIPSSSIGIRKLLMSTSKGNLRQEKCIGFPGGKQTPFTQSAFVFPRNSSTLVVLLNKKMEYRCMKYTILS